ncbi:MAG TPA: hypothetical protein DEF88_04200 [Porphyromonadaceae bacterium]|jgi:hypothetical protein|nr:hypothetical protein [Porphyromonadaceae bacterium]HCM20792.1 hypothetical protein [Porphyromonadaceae bacterium]
MKQILLTVLLAGSLALPALSQVTSQDNPEYERQYGEPLKHHDWRVAVGGGYAYRLGKVQKTGDAKLDDLSKQLRNAFNLDADAQYFFKQGWGLGLNANYCSGKVSGDDITVEFQDGDRNITNYKETQNMLFVGPAFVARTESSKFLLVSSLALGPLFYMDEMDLDGRIVNANATTVGFNAGLAGEYKLSAKAGVGLKLSYTVGSVNSVKVEGQTAKFDEPMNVSNLMLTAFLSFRTW